MGKSAVDLVKESADLPDETEHLPKGFADFKESLADLTDCFTALAQSRSNSTEIGLDLIGENPQFQTFAASEAASLLHCVRDAATS